MGADRKPTRADVGKWYQTPGMNGTLWTPDKARGAVFIMPCQGKHGACTKVAAVPIEYLAALETLERALNGAGFFLQAAEATIGLEKRRALIVLCLTCRDGIRQHGVFQEPDPVVIKG